MMALFDSHCHVDEPKFDDDREDVLTRMAEAGVTRYAVIGSDMATSRHSADFAAAHPGCYAAIGIHPHEAKGFVEDDLQRLADWSKEEKVVAIGEIGLDYHFPDHSPKELQRAFFVKQLRIPDKLSLPVVIHSREACADTLAILHENRALLKKGFLMHCFSYAAETVNEFLSLGAYFSFGGVSTFKKAEKVRRAAVIVPKERILTETDSPYLTPEPFRGIFPNEPKNIPYIAANLASLRGENEEEFCAAVIGNAKRLFSALGESV